MLFLFTAANPVRASQTQKFASVIGVLEVIGVLVALTTMGCEPQSPVKSTPPTQVAPDAPSMSVASPSVVASYLTGAEIQTETDDQRAEVRTALADMLMLTADELQAKRYADFAGVANKRTLVELISNHLLPSAPRLLDAATFFADVKSLEAQSAVRAKLAEVDKSSAPARP